MEKQKAERNSGIELLKIFSIVIIAFSHAMPCGYNNNIPAHFMNLNMETKSVQRMIIVLFKYGGMLGNIIFIISSAWFLLESKKINIKKIMYMIGDCFAVSVFFLICFLVAGYDLETKEIIKQFMPTYTEANWFIGCYILFYMIHPMLNTIIEAFGKEKLLVTNIGMVFIYCGLQFLRPGSMYYSNLIGFICIYFIVAYVKKYLDKMTGYIKANRVILMLSLLANFLLILATNFLGFHIGCFSNKLLRWSTLVNPFLILSALSMFLLAKQKKFINHTINYVSGLSMLIYIFHDNKLIIDYLISDFFEYIYGTFSYRYELLWVILAAIILLIFGFVMGVIYRNSLQKLVHGVCDRIYKFAELKCNSMLEKILKLE